MPDQHTHALIVPWRIGRGGLSVATWCGAEDDGSVGPTSECDCPACLHAMRIAWLDLSTAAFEVDDPEALVFTDDDQPLAEQIADAARLHGSMCARRGAPYTSTAWQELRRLLKLIVEARHA